MHHRTKCNKNPLNDCGNIIFNVFQNGGRSPRWILKMNFKQSLNVEASVRDCAKFCRDRPNGVGNIILCGLL